MNVLHLYTHFIFEHLCYNFFAIMNYAAMNNLVRVYWYTCVCVCLFRIQRELVGHLVCVDLFLYDQCCFLFKNSYSEVRNIVSLFVT